MAGLEQVAELLEKIKGTKTLIVCMGNRLKADDAAASAVYHKIVGKISADLIDAGTVPENYIEPIIKKAPANILVIDAIDFEGPAGAIRCFEPAKIQAGAISTHALSPRLFAQLISARFDTKIYFLGIQPLNIKLGQQMSPEVTKAADTLAQLLVETFPKQ